MNVSEGTADNRTEQADRSPDLHQSKSKRPSNKDKQADRSHAMRQTKSGRTSRHPKRYGFLAASPIASFIDDLEQRILNPTAFITHQLSRAHSLNCDLPFTEDDLKFPFALPAATTDANSDTPTYKQAMSGEYKHEFKKLCLANISTNSRPQCKPNFQNLRSLILSSPSYDPLCLQTHLY